MPLTQQISDTLDQYFTAIPEKVSYMHETLLLEHCGLYGLLDPRSELEAEWLSRPEIIKGLLWGTPRYGHPEGTVAFHINEVYRNIDALADQSLNAELRLVALIHDTFKYEEDRSMPRDWSRHHGNIAAKYMTRDYCERHIVNLVKLHDEAFYAWRAFHQHSNQVESERRLKIIEESMEENLKFYVNFFICDTLTGDKIKTPIVWLVEQAQMRNWF